MLEVFRYYELNFRCNVNIDESNTLSIAKLDNNGNGANTFDTAAGAITVDGAVDVEGGSIALTAATSLTTNSAITSNGGTIALTANAGNVTVASSY